jgi:hypothetical protein
LKCSLKASTGSNDKSAGEPRREIEPHQAR